MNNQSKAIVNIFNAVVKHGVLLLDPVYNDRPIYLQKVIETSTEKDYLEFRTFCDIILNGKSLSLLKEAISGDINLNKKKIVLFFKYFIDWSQYLDNLNWNPFKKDFKNFVKHKLAYIESFKLSCKLKKELKDC